MNAQVNASMSMPIRRRPTRQVRVGDCIVGSDAPVVVQSMTNTDTADAEATAREQEEREAAEARRSTLRPSS